MMMMFGFAFGAAWTGAMMAREHTIVRTKKRKIIVMAGTYLSDWIIWQRKDASAVESSSRTFGALARNGRGRGEALWARSAGAANSRRPPRSRGEALARRSPT